MVVVLIAKRDVWWEGSVCADVAHRAEEAAKEAKVRREQEAKEMGEPPADLSVVEKLKWKRNRRKEMAAERRGDIDPDSDLEKQDPDQATAAVSQALLFTCSSFLTDERFRPGCCKCEWRHGVAFVQ